MGKRKRAPTLAEILERPWCYYCERDFDDLQVLVSHQKIKHFKCNKCHRRLNTAGGLRVHVEQVHKETITTIDDALPNRAEISAAEIFGMEGIPEDIKLQHEQRITQKFLEDEVNRKGPNGNHSAAALLANGGAGAAPKKPKVKETMEEIKARLAVVRARKEAIARGEIPADEPSAPGTPMEGVKQEGQSPMVSYEESTAPYAAGIPFHDPTQQYPQPPYGSGPLPGQGLPEMYYGAPPPHQPYPHPHPDFARPPSQAGPFLPQAFPPPGPYPPQSQFIAPPPNMFGQPRQMSPYQPGMPFGGPPPHMASPAPPHGYHQDPRGFQNRSHGSPPNPTPPQRSISSGLPPAPGLPAKPAVVPTATQWEMQQYHHGIVNAPLGINNGAGGPKIKDEDLDELFADVAKNGSAPAAAKQIAAEPPAAPQPPHAELPTPAPTAHDTTNSATTEPVAPAAPTQTDPKRKPKVKQTKLVYSDNATSPEEKMAQFQKYKFEMTDLEKMHDREETVLAEATATMTGTVGTPPEE